MQMRLNGYSNPTGQCGQIDECRTSSGQLRCCDGPLVPATDCSFGARCDSYFIYCLRRFGELQLSTQLCRSKQVRSRLNSNDGPRDFSQSRVLGLDNPLNLSGFGGAYNVSVS